MILITGFLLLFINRAFSEICVLDDGSRYLNKEIILRSDLLASYNALQSPQNTTAVELRFILKYFYFENDEEVFNTYSWLFLAWNDERLKWDPSKYDGIAETELGYFWIWSPKLKQESKLLYSEYDYLSVILNSGCQVTNTGGVICLTHALSKSECISDLTNWPYDVQTCTVKFSLSSLYERNTIISFHSSRGISTFAAEYGPGWNIIDYKTEDNITCGSQISMTFVLERQGASVAAIVVFPSFALSILTVSSLLVDVHNTRVGMQMLSLVTHIYILTFVNSFVPNYGAKMPSVLRFINASLLLTFVTVLLSFVLSSLRRKKVAPQNWIFAVNEYVFNSRVKCFIWPRRESTNHAASSNETVKYVDIWTDFTYVLNTVCIVIFIIVYIIIVLCLVPRELPMDYTTL